jgi:SAM-dependent methyltransferase
MTDEMLEVARRNAPIVAERIGYANVEFRKGRIQDLALDLEFLDRQLKQNPINDATSFLAADELAEELRVKHPLVASDSIDVVVSNCVLNLVEPKSKRQLFDEIFRVLKKGGRAVISDIVSDEEVPEEMQNDPELWSDCISGAFTEEGFIAAFEKAGFYGIQILKRDAKPWRTVQGIEFRSVTIEAFKGKQGACFERNQAVIYRGPFKEVLDDDNHRMERGKRYAVCDKTYNLYKKAPYREFFEFVDPIVDVLLSKAKPFDCSRTSPRHPKETKGQDYNATTEANSKCCDGGSCC